MVTPTQAQPSDPVARAVLIAMAAGLAWLGMTLPAQPSAAQLPPVIIVATATPALPMPALELAAPTAPQAALQAAPAGPAAPQATPADTQPAETASGSLDNAAYLANVADQAEHSPRGDVDAAPVEDAAPTVDPAGPVEADPHASKPAPDRADHYDQATAPDDHAAAVPPITEEQAQIIGERTSDTCPAGEIFYPRSGCHAPGSGGPMPGAVGEQSLLEIEQAAADAHEDLPIVHFDTTPAVPNHHPMPRGAGSR